MSDKNTINGDRNLFVCGDLLVTVEDLKGSDKQLSRLVKSKLKATDEFVARNFPNGVISHKAKSPAPFSSEVILGSLGSLGVPLIAGLEILNEAVRSIGNQYHSDEPIPTRYVRAHITEALYGLCETTYKRSRIEKWGDAYVRRYGSNTPIQIIMPDGSERELNFDLLHKDIIPSLIESITSDVGFILAKEGIVTSSAMRKMADEVLEVIPSLNVYRLHYETLCSICREICLQPPHPWFSTRVRDFEYVNYDYERYKVHYRKAARYRSEGRPQKCFYALKEFIHHSCSAYLSFYSIYMGCGTLAPLYVLRNILSKIISGDDGKLHSMFRLSEIKSDLKKNDHNLKQLYSVLKSIDSNLQSNREPSTLAVESLFNISNDLFGIITKNIASFIRIEKLKRLDLGTNNCLNITINDIFMCFPLLEWDWYETKDAFWLIHSYEGRGFREIKSNILFVTIPIECNLQETISLWVSRLKKHSKLCNSIIFLSHEQAVPIKDLIDEDNFQKYFFSSFSFNDLVDIVLSDDPVKRIEKEIISQQ